jgi:hypothetical protein
MERASGSVEWNLSVWRIAHLIANVVEPLHLGVDGRAIFLILCSRLSRLELEINQSFPKLHSNRAGVEDIEQNCTVSKLPANVDSLKQVRRSAREYSIPLVGGTGIEPVAPAVWIKKMWLFII